MKSKKERAFYAQVILVSAYTVMRFFNREMAAMDGTFTTLMVLLASYNVVQGAVDFKHGAPPK